MERINIPEIDSDSTIEIPENVLDEFKVFLKQVPIDRLNIGLRKLLIDYLFYNIDGLPVGFKELLTDLYWLHELLDEIQQAPITALDQY